MSASLGPALTPLLSDFSLSQLNRTLQLSRKARQFLHKWRRSRSGKNFSFARESSHTNTPISLSHAVYLPERAADAADRAAAFTTNSGAPRQYAIGFRCE
jgi:hypothetical protein